MINHTTILQIFGRSAALQRVECFRLDTSDIDIQDQLLDHERDLHEEHHDSSLYFAQR
ncbi:hypothetical protein I4U23_018170 [Adineta vaga]|nr:hypothetical protein I4U23_018170 [Adineta vaga]